MTSGIHQPTDGVMVHGLSLSLFMTRGSWYTLRVYHAVPMHSIYVLHGIRHIRNTCMYAYRGMLLAVYTQRDCTPVSTIGDTRMYVRALVLLTSMYGVVE